MNLYTYKIGLPALGANDVVKRELHVTVNGDKKVFEINNILLESYELILEEGANVELFMIDIDGAGNRSAEGERLMFTAIDMVPPSAPSSPTIQDVVLIVEEVTDEVVADEVVADEVVADEVVADEVVADEVVAEEVVAEEVVAEEVVADEVVADEVVADEVVAEEATDEVVAEEVTDEVVAEEENTQS